MILDLLYDAFRRTNSKTEQSKIDGSKVAECQRNNPINDILNKPEVKSDYSFKGTKKDDYQALKKKR